MKKRLYLSYSLILAIVLIISASLISALPSASISNVNIGNKVRVDIEGNNTIDLSGIQATLGYNQSLMKYNRTEAGTFFNTNNGNQLFLDVLDTSQLGKVKDIVIFRRNLTNGGVNGSGVIASVYFTAIGAGSSSFTIDSVLLPDSKGNETNKTSFVALKAVLLLNAGDLNSDGVVNQADLDIISKDWGKTSGFNPLSDQKPDGVINIYDIVVVLQYWGITYQ